MASQPLTLLEKGKTSIAQEQRLQRISVEPPAPAEKRPNQEQQEQQHDAVKRRKLDVFKCTFCRNAKQKCLPAYREWPEKCIRCASKGLQCSEPKKAVRRREDDASDSEPSTSVSHKRSKKPASRELRPPRFAEIVQRILNPINHLGDDYKFGPLHEDVRLLTVHPGTGSDTIYCHLDQASLSTSDSISKVPSYQALSYIWNWETDRPTHEIRILNRLSRPSGISLLRDVAWKIAKHSLGSRFYIRPNLFNALTHLRSPVEDVVLWVDALCINALDIRERNFQIRNMQEIYGKAENVCIWLGNSTPMTDMAISFIPSIVDFRNFENLVSDDLALDEWHAFGELMKNSWFKRRWVLQEVVSAKKATLHCGSKSVAWPDFAVAVALFSANISQIRKLFRFSRPDPLGDRHNFSAIAFIDATSNMARRSSDGGILSLRWSIESLVSNLYAFEATNPVDTIYALLPVARDSSDILVDYSQPPPNLFADFIQSCIVSSGTLDIICRHWAPVKPTAYTSRYTLPSWVLTVSGSAYDFSEDSYRGRINGDSFVGSPNRRIYNAAEGYGSASVSFETVHFQNRTVPCLNARGVKIDSLDELGPRSVQGIIFQESLEMSGLGSKSDIGSISSVPEKLWRTLVADRAEDGLNPPSWYPRACLECLFHRNIQGDIITSGILNDIEKAPRMLQTFLHRVQAVIWNRKFFRTKDRSLFGLVPSQTRQGDIICILYGCSVPVVLRPHNFDSQRIARVPVRAISSVSALSAIEDQDSYYEFIGECFVYGLMDGEAHSVLRSVTPQMFNLV